MPAEPPVTVHILANGPELVQILNPLHSVLQHKAVFSPNKLQLAPKHTIDVSWFIWYLNENIVDLTC